MIKIDGSQGEGGGQIIRSSLALSVVTQTPISISNIRAGRKKSGLKKQHVTCVRAAAEICEGKVTGDQLNSSSLTFEPGAIKPGDYSFEVGTAGSTSLVAQTVLPALMLATEPSTVAFSGGTHNPWAPPFHFLTKAFFPQLEKMGPRVAADLISYGFFPAGGGKFSITIQPQHELTGLELIERGCKKPTPRVRAVVANLPSDIGVRECDVIRRKMSWTESCCEVIELQDSVGTGNVVMIELHSPNVTELMIGIGQRGVAAEQVARSVVREAKAYLASDVPVGQYLADQLMMPMGLAASQGHTSRFRTGPLSLHSKTHIDVLQTFLPIAAEVQEESKDCFVVKFAPK